MNLRTFLLLDSFLLDMAGIAALVAGQLALGVALFLLAGLTFAAYLARGRRAGVAA